MNSTNRFDHDSNPTTTTTTKRRRTMTLLLSSSAATCGCLFLLSLSLLGSSHPAHALTLASHQGATSARGGAFRHPAPRITTSRLSSSLTSSSSSESSYWGRRISYRQDSVPSAARKKHPKSVTTTTTMDLEVPHPKYTTTTGPGSHRSRGFLSRPTATVRVPAAAASESAKTTCGAPDIEASNDGAANNSPASATGASTTSTAYFQHFWDKQLEVMNSRLRNLQEIPLPTSATQDMSVVENDSSRMITKSFRSDEYSYVRMTLLKGRHSQVFTSVWYPTSPHLPILACDLLQFGGASQQQRHLCIVDYQPVIVTDARGSNNHDDELVVEHSRQITQRVEAIRQQYPGLHGEMSKRFYPEGSPYFSSQMLLGRHLGSSSGGSAQSTQRDDDSSSSYETSDEMVHDVYEAWQSYMDEHVSWTQHEKREREGDAEENMLLRIRRHSSYDQFSSRYDPALPMLSHMYGSDFADAYVHDVLFPLSRRDIPTL